MYLRSVSTYGASAQGFGFSVHVKIEQMVCVNGGALQGSEEDMRP